MNDSIRRKKQNDKVRKAVSKHIKKMQTAYSVDKVVEELSKNKRSAKE